MLRRVLNALDSEFFISNCNGTGRKKKSSISSLRNEVLLCTYAIVETWIKIARHKWAIIICFEVVRHKDVLPITQWNRNRGKYLLNGFFLTFISNAFK